MNTQIIVWIVTGFYGKKRRAYTGSYSTRKEAIYDHCKALGKTWEECRKKGDRVQKALLTFKHLTNV